MKRLLTILCLVLLSVHSYSQGVIPEVETVTKDGLIYHQLSTEPLTGTVSMTSLRLIRRGLLQANLKYFWITECVRTFES